jgi:hypothetical protein
LFLPPAHELQPAPLFAPTLRAAKPVLEFFTAQINNDHTRKPNLNATRRNGRKVKTPTLRKTRRVGDPEKPNQPLGVDIQTWHHPTMSVRQKEKRERVGHPPNRISNTLG